MCLVTTVHTYRAWVESRLHSLSPLYDDGLVAVKKHQIDSAGETFVDYVDNVQYVAEAKID